MTREALIKTIQQKGSFLCVGLDTDIEKIPAHFLKHKYPLFEFNKAIIDATKDYCVAYKPNIAFYEAYGSDGWKQLEMTAEYLPDTHFKIADAKRGDIGNTSTRYAKAFFEELGFDSITIAPYMGKDSVEPFLAFNNKHTILLALTSNEGAFDYQTKIVDGIELYKKVLQTSKTYANAKNLMYVVGATKASHLSEIRKIIPNNFLLVPGVGAQGGSLKEVCKYGMNEQIGLLVNSSRGIIYASKGNDFANEAAKKAKELQLQMKEQLKIL